MRFPVLWYPSHISAAPIMFARFTFFVRSSTYLDDVRLDNSCWQRRSLNTHFSLLLFLNCDYPETVARLYMQYNIIGYFLQHFLFHSGFHNACRVNLFIKFCLDEPYKQHAFRHKWPPGATKPLVKKGSTETAYLSPSASILLLNLRSDRLFCSNPSFPWNGPA